MLETHLIDPGKRELRWGRIGVGQYYTVPERRIYTLHVEPWNPLPIDNYAFDVLKGRLFQTGYDYKISENGRVSVSVPKGSKMGYILGWIAWSYHVLTEDAV